MDRRYFMAAGGCALTTACMEGAAGAGGRPVSTNNVRVLDQREVGPDRSYGYRRIADPTGTAPTASVERFELRGGDCHRGDCIARELNGRMVTRGRVEQMYGLDVGEGDDFVYSYSVYFPSDRYQWATGVGATYGQVLFRPVRRSDEESRPIWSLDTDRSTDRRRFYTAMVEAEDSEGATDTKRYREATQGGFASAAMPMDRWINFTVYTRLSSDPSRGFIRATRNGTPAGQLTGRTMTPGGGVEIRYGIYMTGTNQHAGGAGNIPTQVVYYAGVSFQRTSFA